MTNFYYNAKEGGVNGDVKKHYWYGNSRAIEVSYLYPKYAVKQYNKYGATPANISHFEVRSLINFIKRKNYLLYIIYLLVLRDIIESPLRNFLLWCFHINLLHKNHSFVK
jgi:hypothetical protein